MYNKVLSYTYLPRPAQKVRTEEKVNIKQDIETFILIKYGDQVTQGLRDQNAASRNYAVFIVLFRITSSEEGAVGAEYSSFIMLKVT